MAWFLTIDPSHFARRPVLGSRQRRRRQQKLRLLAPSSQAYARTHSHAPEFFLSIDRKEKGPKEKTREILPRLIGREIG